MDATVTVAALGLISTLAASLLTAYAQRRGNREARVFDARVAAYGELTSALFDYERATYNRVKARLGSLPEQVRETLRQDAWTSNARARSAIAVVALLSSDATLHERFEDVRSAIGEMNEAIDGLDLKERHESIYAALDSLLATARTDVTVR